MHPHTTPEQCKFLKEFDHDVHAEWQRRVDLISELKGAEMANLMRQRFYATYYNDPYMALKPGRIYLLGLNPGGPDDYKYDQPEEPPFDWGDKFNETGKPYSSFLDEEWSASPGNAPYQRNVTRLVMHLHGRSREDDPDAMSMRTTFATNVCFLRTPNAEELWKYPPELIDWHEFHERLVAIVQPEIILCIGNQMNQSSSFSILHHQQQSPRYEEYKVNDRRNVRAFVADKLLPDKQIKVIGVPHLSQPFASMDDVCAATDKAISEMNA